MTRFSTQIAVLLALAGVTMAAGCQLIVGGHNVPGTGGSESSSSSSSSGATTGTGGTGGKGTGGSGGTSTGGSGGTGTGGSTGGSGGSTGGTGGTGPTCMTTTCTMPTDCPNTPSECVLRTCDMNCCGTTNEPDLKPTTGGQTAEDCQVVVCDGTGMTKSIPDDNDPLDDGNDCTIDACSNGSPTNLPAPAGTTCTSNNGKLCDGNKNCVECLQNTDCMNGEVCDPLGGTNTCVNPNCTDTQKNGEETDVDCGGNQCAPCVNGKVCLLPADCQSGVCTGGTCQVPACNDTVKNGTETDVDCGSTCTNKCGPGLGCAVDADCVGGSCSGTVCLPTCIDAVKNGGETDVDCGGATCAKCIDGKTCSVGADCTSGVCTNGTCQAPTCTDSTKNAAETDVDCGGPTCQTCATGKGCAVANDCASGVCGTGSPKVCLAPTCTDLVKNGTETDIDCGGAVCNMAGKTCAVGKVCSVNADCTSNVCMGGLCVAAACGDGIKSTGEGCDDNNTTNGDGCSSLCFVEFGFTCTGSPSVCTTTCGDGFKASTEGCDDHNTAANDGCSPTCMVEAGYTCTGTVNSVCTTTCGDGIRAGAEGCDDQNLTNNDGCSATCAVEAGWSCTGNTPTTCSPICGNGAKHGAETCDDGNTTNGDGCSSTCGVEAGWSCPGVGPGSCTPICGDGQKLGAEACDDGNTTNGDGCSSTCGVEFGYTCTGVGPGSCTSTCGDGKKASNEGCDDGNATANDGCTACAVDTGYTCTGTQPSVCNTTCGDGIKAGSEACDDGNTTSNDGCSSACAVEFGYTCPGQGPGSCTSTCGDGSKASNEPCDDGNLNNGDGCSATCQVEPGYTCVGNQPSSCSAGCGDGIKAGSEGCDDGNNTNGDGCSAACNAEPGWACAGQGPGSCAPICGDGLKVGLEICDDGNLNNGDGCSSLCTTETGWSCVGAGAGSCTPICGDNLKLGAETCDDGNTTSGDGCSATCAQEAGWTCTGTGPASCAANCGDGVKLGAEVCDDGNTTSGDGCSSLCTTEAGWSCVGAGAGSCTPICGDSLKVGTEPCDDGNTTSGDGCSATCVVEAGFTCPGVGPGSCTAICGDNQIKGAEQCDDGNTANGDGCSSTCQLEPGFEIEPNNTIATANDFFALAIAGKVNGRFTPAADKDFYAITIPAGFTGSITAQYVDNFAGTPCAGTALDTILSLLTASGARISENDDIAGSSNRCSRIIAGGLVPGTYYLEARAFSTSGTFPYSLTATVTLAACGNGILEASEGCDDGNTNNGDGCSSVCKVEPKSDVEPNSTCATGNGTYTMSIPGLLLDGVVAQGWTTTGSTADQDWFKFTITSFSDVQFEVFDSTGPGTCQSLIAADLQLFQSNCTTQIGSTKTTGGINSCPKINPTTDTFARHLAPGTYNVRVNTTSSSASATFGYVLKANLVASCGNGIVEGSEECDGGATCAADCTILPVCGNGLKQTGETCDDGNTVPGDGCGMTCQWESVAETDASNNTCAAPNGPFAIPTHSVGLLVTGAMNTTSDQDWFAITVPNYADLHIQTFDSTGPNSCNTIDTNLELYNSTACGTALATNDTGGVNNCSLITAAAAGARHVAPGTYVVKVNGFSATFNYMLQVKFTALCGNGIVEGSEQCDGGAGCNADCTATVACGNGILQGSEACDDGNLVDGDGCTSTCTVELGYACAGTSPNRCAPICGDNILVAPETCDGGNTLNGDTCDSSCRIEASLTEIEANDTLATADTNATNGILISSVSTVITGAVTPIADKDIFKMNLASTGVVRLEMFDSSGNDCTSANVATATRLTVVGTTPCTVATQATACAGIGPSATCNATTLTCQVNTDSGSGIGNCSALVLNMNAGTYYAIVEKAAPTTGVPFNYKLQVAVQTNRGNESETNELFSAADGITGSDVYVFGSHQNQPDFDTFAIFVPAGKSIRAETIEGSGETCESNGIDSRITLLNSAGTVLGNDSDAGRGFCSLIDGTGATAANSFAKGLTAGIYYLRVEAHTPASGSASMQFDYRLVVTIR